MPELPEAETIVRSLRAHVEGRRIQRAEFLSKRVSKQPTAACEGRWIEAVERYGKQIAFRLDEGYLLVKLGMTGALLWDGATGPYTRAVFAFEHGRLCFDDVRQFGSVAILEAAPAHFGPDPFEITAAEFAERLRGRDTVVKRALLDQGFVRGVGNIYADEALHRAGIHPEARTRRLRLDRAELLHRVTVDLLRTAIEHRGSSISDYVDASGERGGFQRLHLVYGKEGEPCAGCGSAIARIVVGQRGTHYCPRCQTR